jgi:TusA-related sulfurtransferase
VSLLDTPPRADQTLDTLGSYCPIPVIRTARAIEKMQCGQVLELLSDDRGVLGDIPDWCRSHGHQYLGRVDEARHYRLYLRKV